MNTRIPAILLALFVVLPGAWGQQVNKTMEMLPQATYAAPNDVFLVTTGIVGNARSTRGINTSNLLESLAALTNWTAHAGSGGGSNGQFIARNSGTGSNTTFNGWMLLSGLDFTNLNGRFVLTNTITGGQFVIGTNGNLYSSDQNGTKVSWSTNWFEYMQTNGYGVLFSNNLWTVYSSTNTDWVSNEVVTGWELIQGAETNSSILGPGLLGINSSGGRSAVTVGSGLNLSGGNLTATGGGGGNNYITNLNGAGTNVSFYLPASTNFVNVYQSDGSLFFSISNGVVTIGTNSQTGQITISANGTLQRTSTNATVISYNREGTNGSPFLLLITGTNSMVTASNLTVNGSEVLSNSFASYANNKSSLMSSNVATGTWLFTNTDSVMWQCFIGGAGACAVQGVGYGTTPLFVGNSTNILTTVILQPGESLGITNTTAPLFKFKRL